MKPLPLQQQYNSIPKLIRLKITKFLHKQSGKREIPSVEGIVHYYNTEYKK